MTYDKLKKSIVLKLFSNTDIAPLIFFRIAFGMIMLWLVSIYFFYGSIKPQYIDPKFFFTYLGFEWVKPWPGMGMYIHFAALGILSIFITIGFIYRASITLFFLGFTYIFLLDKTHYQNHFYLICLVSFLMIFIPCNKKLSVDSFINPKIRSEFAPTWSLWTLRLQFAIVYVFAGIAKINGDWLNGQPMRMTLAVRSDLYNFVGPYFKEEWVVYLFSYSGLFLDLFVVPLLFWKPTRLIALFASILFHRTNSLFFGLDIFPLFMMIATFMFLPANWFRFDFSPKKINLESSDTFENIPSLNPLRKTAMILLCAYFLFQFLIPFRHFLYPGNVSWTEEGHRFSWRMMLRHKVGKTQLVAYDPDHRISVNNEYFLHKGQIQAMQTRPDMIVQFSHFIAEDLTQKGYSSIKVKAISKASLNGRKFQQFINPNIDMNSQNITIAHTNWVVPLKHPVPRSLEEITQNLGIKF